MKYKVMLKWFLFITFIIQLNFKTEKNQKRPDNILKDTLFDKQTGNKFFIDKDRLVVTAIDKNGKVLWKTNPFKDSFLPVYRTLKPVIVYFALGYREHKEVIYISYNSSQFGYLIKTNGKFCFEGND